MAMKKVFSVKLHTLFENTLFYDVKTLQIKLNNTEKIERGDAL